MKDNKKTSKTINKNQVSSIEQKAFCLGQVLNTKDEYIPQGKKGRKNKSPEGTKKESRTILVVDLNKKGNSGYAPLRGKAGADRTKVRDTYVKHFFETVDNEGEPVNPNNKKFQASNRKRFSLDEISQVRKVLFEKSKQKERNEKRYKDFHNNDK